ncbi:MAG: YitT family protein [Bacteriovoracaceae bacterium]
MTNLSRSLINFLLVICGVLCAGMGLKGFLFSSNFIDGGVTGVSQLLAKTTSVPLSVWIPLVNIPFIAIGLRALGKIFALKSVLAITGLALAVAYVPFPDITPDPILTAIFGGFFIGAGIGLAVRGGAVLDGTEIAALLISRENGTFRVGDVILAFNIVLFLVAIAFLGVEPALYSILTYMAAARTLNFVLYGLEEFTAITIVSTRGPEIRKGITSELGRGVTIIKGAGAITNIEKEILYCVVTRLEIEKIKTITRELDPGAFITMSPLVDVVGGTVRRTH